MLKRVTRKTVGQAVLPPVGATSPVGATPPCRRSFLDRRQDRLSYCFAAPRPVFQPRGDRVSFYVGDEFVQFPSVPYPMTERLILPKDTAATKHPIAAPGGGPLQPSHDLRKRLFWSHDYVNVRGHHYPGVQVVHSCPVDQGVCNDTGAPRIGKPAVTAR